MSLDCASQRRMIVNESSSKFYYHLYPVIGFLGAIQIPAIIIIVVVVLVLS